MYLEFMPDVPASVVQQHNIAAANYFADVFPMIDDLSQFIAGFQDLKDLIPSIQESVLKTLSGGLLNYEFGWVNLQSDLKELSSATDSVSKRLLELKRQYGKINRYRYTASDIHPVNFLFVEKEIRLPNYRSVRGIRLVPTSYQANYSASCRIFNTLDFIDGWIGYLRALVAGLGFDNPIKQIWANLPLSFVADWFFNISGRLDYFIKARPAAGWNISHVTHTVDEILEVKVADILAGGLFSSEYDVDKRDAGTVLIKRYERGLGLPVGWESFIPDLSAISPSKAALILALLNQRG